MNKELLNKSISIFDTQDKWDALFEIHNHSQEIIKHWLTIGAKELRISFEDNAVFECTSWGNELDIRWYLKEYGPLSVGIGFGWIEVELHLLTTNKLCYKRALEILARPAFKPLLDLFNLTLNTSSRYESDGSLAYNRTINPFSGAGDIQVRQREMAWVAAHESQRYVEKMGGIIRQLAADGDCASLFRELNRQFLECTSAMQVAQP